MWSRRIQVSPLPANKLFVHDYRDTNFPTVKRHPDNCSELSSATGKQEPDVPGVVACRTDPDCRYTAAMPAKPTTVHEYLAGLPDDRREALQSIRKVIRKNLPKGYEEGIQYGMIGYFVPHRVYPPGYHCDPKQPVPFAGLASQKNHIGLYLMCIYSNDEHRQWFVDAWTATGRKLDMGKGCIRVKSLEDVPLEVLGEAVKRVTVKQFIEHYEATVPAAARRASKIRSTSRTNTSTSRRKSRQ